MSRLEAWDSSKARPGVQARFAHSLGNVPLRQIFKGAVILTHREKDGDL
jgi:hypothetical protein